MNIRVRVRYMGGYRPYSRPSAAPRAKSEPLTATEPSSCPPSPALPAMPPRHATPQPCPLQPCHVNWAAANLA